MDMVIGGSFLFGWIIIVVILDCSADGLSLDNERLHICLLSTL